MINIRENDYKIDSFHPNYREEIENDKIPSFFKGIKKWKKRMMNYSKKDIFIKIEQNKNRIPYE